MTLSSASGLFESDGEVFLPTDLTRGGWSDDAQHGGPPAGLLARAIERHRDGEEMAVVRITLDLVRPVPLTRIRVTTRFVRPGRRVQLIEAILEAGGVETARATGLRIRTTDLELPEIPETDWSPPPGPEKGAEPVWGDWGDPASPFPRFHRNALEIRSIDRTFESAGPGLAWFRLRVPLVAGEKDSYVTRLATISDMGNGTSAAIDPREYLFVNPDISLYIHRPTEAVWIGLRSIAYQRRQGLGVADSLVFDEEGPLGRIVQAQLIDRRV